MLGRAYWMNRRMSTEAVIPVPAAVTANRLKKENPGPGAEVCLVFFDDVNEKAGASSNASQAALEDGGRLETNRLGGGDFHGFSRFWVAALAGSTLFDFEGTESNDLDFLVFLHAFGDRGENGFEGFVGSALGSVFSEGGLDGINKFSFVHGDDVCANGIGGWQEKI